MAAAALVLQVAGRLTAQATNPIPTENQLAGNPRSEWDITGSGDSTIQGFATDISVNKGGAISFKVTTTAASFSINIYRLGYYQGNGARKVATISPVTGKSQAACITDAATGLYDCGNWTVSSSWTVPANAVSGIYIARLARSDNGGASHIPFIVRDDAAQADIILQTDDTTWQAYNQYGGHSVYLGTPTRGYKVSYNRPFATRGQSTGYGTSNYLFYAEYPAIRWLEANGYNVKYQSGVDTDRYGSSLTGVARPKVLMTVGHDEYWSEGMRDAAEAARNAGVNIAMFTGNEVFWKTRWETSIDGNATPYRTLVTYKETHENKVFDPMDPPTWTGTWRDPRFSPPADGNRPENSLTGQLFTVNRGTAAITVPGIYAPLRFWRNTAVAALAPNQSLTLAQDTLGYEWDEDIDNATRPAGSMQLSQTVVNVPERVQDMGSTYLPGTATHHLSMYRHSSGALVFGAGTVQWVWGLDTNHDTDPDFGSATPDANIRQATLNLLADMGAQPATIQSGLIPAMMSADSTAPISTMANPVASASIPAGTIVTISGSAVDAGGGIVAAVEVSTDGGTTWRRASGTNNWSYAWVPGVLGTATVMSRATDDSGNIESSPTPVSVTITQANCPCSIWTPSLTVPWMVDSNDGAAVEVGLKFTTDVGGMVNGLRFYKAATNTGSHVGHLWTKSGTLLSTVTFSGESSSGWQQANFASPAIIQPNTIYVISYYAPNGHYSDDQYFLGRAAVDQWPLHAPKSTAAEPNGVFFYGASGFPNQTWFSDSYAVDVIFTPDLVMPTVALTAPANGANISGNAVTVSATASDNISVAGVQFKIDGVNVGAEDTASPYSIAWNSTLTANGTHTLTAVARDAAGNLTTSAGVTVSVFNADTVPPSVSISAPANSATVHGTVSVVAAASDNQGVAGVQFMVDGALVGSELNAPPYTMTWDTSALATNSTHTLQARARDTSNNVTTSAASTVTVVNPVAGAPAIDALVWVDQPNNQGTVTSPVFSTTTGNQLVLAFIATDYLGGTNTSVTGVTGGGLTWALAGRTNVQAGSSEVWRAFAPSPLTNVSVVASLSQAVDSMMTVVSFSNVDTSGTNGSGAIGATASANSIAAAPSATLTTTRNNSWVFGVGNDYDTATNRTVGANQVLVHQYFPPVGDTYWVQRALNPTPVSGTAVTINDTQPNGDRYNLFIVEIKALNAPDVTPPTVSMTAPANGATISGKTVTVSATASDNVAVTSVQFKLDGANLGAADTATPYRDVGDRHREQRHDCSDCCGNRTGRRIHRVGDRDGFRKRVGQRRRRRCPVQARWREPRRRGDRRAVRRLVEHDHVGERIAFADRGGARRGRQHDDLERRRRHGEQRRRDTADRRDHCTFRRRNRRGQQRRGVGDGIGQHRRRWRAVPAGRRQPWCRGYGEPVLDLVEHRHDCQRRPFDHGDRARRSRQHGDERGLGDGEQRPGRADRLDDGAGRRHDRDRHGSHRVGERERQRRRRRRAIPARRRGSRDRGNDGAVSDRVELGERGQRQPYALGARARRRGQPDDVGGCDGDRVERRLDAAGDRRGEVREPIDQRDHARQRRVLDNESQRAAARVHLRRLSRRGQHDGNRDQRRRPDVGARPADERSERVV
jgi:hypothetical protein